jgi:hypothetical protein
MTRRDVGRVQKGAARKSQNWSLIRTGKTLLVEWKGTFHLDFLSFNIHNFLFEIL